ncbi:hypothetical protein ACFFVB_03935 [Formosa undariae]|uniref:DUF4136 domain-containing protein n=1 Tax=Formosa undariae TaxID=1325436 RepID=A0ABV5EYJ6_9FLAO
MKTSNYSLLILMITLVLSSCSSVKVLDSWKADNVSSIKDKNILVIARTDNNQARIAFEQEIASHLREKGFKATESFKKLPHIEPNKKLDEAQTAALSATIKREGFDGVVLSVIKDYTEQQQTTTDGGYYAGGTMGGMYGMYPGYYGGFGGYYGHPMGYVGVGTYMPATSTTRTVKTFVLETVAYNLDEVEGKQLVAVVTSSIEDPSSVSKNAAEYADKIEKALK